MCHYVQVMCPHCPRSDARPRPATDIRLSPGAQPRTRPPPPGRPWRPAPASPARWAPWWPGSPSSASSACNKKHNQFRDKSLSLSGGGSSRRFLCRPGWVHFLSEDLRSPGNVFNLLVPAWPRVGCSGGLALSVSIIIYVKTWPQPPHHLMSLYTRPQTAILADNGLVHFFVPFRGMGERGEHSAIIVTNETQGWVSAKWAAWFRGSKSTKQRRQHTPGACLYQLIIMKASFTKNYPKTHVIVQLLPLSCKMLQTQAK